MKSWFDPKVPLLAWDRTPPSRRDALCVLMRTLDLLSEALPLALRTVGSQSFDVQERFWRSFHEFDRHTDVSDAGHNGDETERIRAMADRLEGWREVIEIRIGKPKGTIE
jgi:hypothetical protein